MGDVLFVFFCQNTQPLENLSIHIIAVFWSFENIFHKFFSYLTVLMADFIQNVQVWCLEHTHILYIVLGVSFILQNNQKNTHCASQVSLYKIFFTSLFLFFVYVLSLMFFSTSYCSDITLCEPEAMFYLVS